MMVQAHAGRIPVLLSAGAGSPPWLPSLEAYRKQLLSLLGGKTLLQQERFGSV
jgi:mannose-1-phosphate guanylyltransferase